MTQTRSVTAPLLLALLALAADAAYAQVALRVRATITGIEGNVLSVRTREGKDLRLQLSDQLVVAAAKAMRLDELKPGDYVGTTTQKRPDGTLVAVEVHTLPPAAKPGYASWDLEPDSMMTNGNVAGALAQSSDGRRITIEYQGGAQTVLVPATAPIVTNTPADRTALKVGEYIFTTAAVAADGTLTVQRITVSRDGVKPPQ